MFPSQDAYKPMPTDHEFNSNPQVLISLDNRRKPMVAFCNHCIAKVLRDTGAYAHHSEDRFDRLVTRVIDAGIQTVEVAKFLTGETSVEIAFGQTSSITFILVSTEELLSVLTEVKREVPMLPLPPQNLRPEQLN